MRILMIFMLCLPLIGCATGSGTEHAGEAAKQSEHPGGEGAKKEHGGKPAKKRRREHPGMPAY